MMDCNNCKTLSHTIKLLNDNIAAIIAGYDILFKVISNHETAINQLMTFKSDITLLNSNKTADILPNTDHHCDTIYKHNGSSPPDTLSADIMDNNVIPDSQISVGANLSVFDCSNVDIEDGLNIAPFDNFQPLELSNDDFLNDFSSISEESTVASDLCAGEKSANNINNIDICVNDAPLELNKTFVIGENNLETITSSVSDYIAYERYDSSVFKLFDTDNLEVSTNFTEILNNRSTAFYGLFPYSYGNITHKVKDYSENVYLQKLLNYVDIAYPRFNYNSALVQKYDSGNQFIPHHSDNEECIEEDSSVLTISLGESRTFEFLDKYSNSCHEQLTLNHGDALFMSKASQNHFTHSLLKDTSKNVRISITLRLLKPMIGTSISNKDSCTQTDESGIVKTTTHHEHIIPQTLKSNKAINLVTNITNTLPRLLKMLPLIGRKLAVIRAVIM